MDSSAAVKLLGGLGLFLLGIHHMPPQAVSGWQLPEGFEAGANALGSWLDAAKDPDTTLAPEIFKAIENASKQLSDECTAGRERLLEDVLPRSTGSWRNEPGRQSTGRSAS